MQKGQTYFGIQMLSAQTDATPKGCAGCSRRIRDRYLLKALDKYWHEDCLKCACCDCRLGEVGSTLYTKANLILCRRDYLRMHPSDGGCLSQVVRRDRKLRCLQQAHPCLRDGHEGQGQCVPPRLLRLPAVQSEVLCG
ncbi:LIM domain only protein 3-like isoform X3 [Paramormyrops kingsleyae]|uniref:LIM domain only protein 3-like isoform X3 n=1 Tax=Paramormyrops kingsleyae TaxID=1676925 RepID=UPI000CD65ED3|nr:LIM domain only protein 3-like isoform X3 [Paramormyrops kingsleyae]